MTSFKMASKSDYGDNDFGEDYNYNADVSAINGSGQNYSYYYNGNYTMYTPTATEMFYYYLWTFITPTIFGLITIIGTAGNVLVIYVILGKPAMRTVTNYMLLNLAFADISFLLVCVPFTAYKYASSSWPFGDWACKIVQYFLYVTAYVTVYTLVGISALRFATVVYNNQTTAWRTKSRTIILICLIWIIILLVNVPTLLVHKLKVIGMYSYCGMESYAVSPMFITFFVFAFVVPLCAIVLLYLAIVRHLRSNQPSSIADKGRDRTNRAFKVIVVVVVVFAVSWLPSHVNSFIGMFGGIPQGPYYEVFRILCYAMSYGNSCANPFIYNYASADFRKAFHETMCACLVTRSKPRLDANGTGNTTDSHLLSSKSNRKCNDACVRNPCATETTAMIDKNTNNNPMDKSLTTAVVIANCEGSDTPVQV